MRIDDDSIGRVMLSILNDQDLSNRIHDEAFRHILTSAGYQDPNAACDDFEARYSRFRDEVAPGVGDAVADVLIDEIDKRRSALSKDDDSGRALWDTFSVLFDLTTKENQETIGRYIVSRINTDDLRDFIDQL